MKKRGDRFVEATLPGCIARSADEEVGMWPNCWCANWWLRSGSTMEGLWWAGRSCEGPAASIMADWIVRGCSMADETLRCARCALRMASPAPFVLPCPCGEGVRSHRAVLGSAESAGAGSEDAFESRNVSRGLGLAAAALCCNAVPGGSCGADDIVHFRLPGESMLKARPGIRFGARFAFSGRRTSDAHTIGGIGGARCTC